ncbi:MAG: type II toxin-antitoxin system PemK/MazF family toxin [Actinomycetota bacterium]|nr:type II toxin-antitoxin system PemK/MazF family toxin [Actinomycetota bacterium]
MAQGDLWWLETPNEKGRPVLVVSRDQANHVMQRVTIAPVTRTIRRTPGELSVGADEWRTADRCPRPQGQPLP